MKRIFILAAFALCAFAQQPANGICSQFDTFWKHIYNPSRLVVHDKCTTVTGVIVDATGGKRKDGVRHEGDGDSHFWLRLSSGQTKYLNAGNISNEGGNLVIEVNCLYAVTQADAKAACADWHNPIIIPPVGTKVSITGSWVQDQEHAKWNEIHPAFSIQILK